MRPSKLKGGRTKQTVAPKSSIAVRPCQSNQSSAVLECADLPLHLNILRLVLCILHNLAGMRWQPHQNLAASSQGHYMSQW